MTKVKMLTGFAVIMLTARLAEAKGWNGIIPLRSNRLEVERLIGPSTMPKGSVYRLKDEVVIVDYSDGKCEDVRGTKWAVPRNIVISITVNPRKRLRVHDLGFNLASFKKITDPEVEDAVYFVNEEEGVSVISRTSDDVVISVIYTAAKVDDKLRCESPVRKPSRKRHARFGDSGEQQTAKHKQTQLRELNETHKSPPT